MSDDTIKDALKMIPYGFYAVTSKSDDEVNAMVANWITQISFEPRMVAFGLQKSAHTRSIIEKGRVFTVNLFAKDDREKMMPFTKGRSRNPDKMKDAQYSEAPVTGCPILDGASAFVEFEVTDIVDPGGDHDIVIGKAVGAGVLKSGDASQMLTLPDIGWSYAG
jgi:flavin reductase (DIM6/NTAB) family NADH-FMN oxidoreductase RutF